MTKVSQPINSVVLVVSRIMLFSCVLNHPFVQLVQLEDRTTMVKDMVSNITLLVVYKLPEPPRAMAPV